MNPQPSFCPIETCPSRGGIGAGNLRVHDRLRNRWKCTVCKKTFSGRRGTPFYGLKHDEQTVTLVITLLAFGCPPQAIVHAFELDTRTVLDWLTRAGEHCQTVHTELVQTPQQRTYVQADEIRVKGQNRLVVWMAMALCVPSRLWLGGVVSSHRDKRLARDLAARVRDCCRLGPVLVVTDGWKAYAEAFAKAFRSPIRTGQPGRPSLLAWPDFVLAQTVKWGEKGRTLGIRVCPLTGNRARIASLLPVGQVLSTAYIERLNATFRQRFASLCRRTRCLLRSEERVQAGMYLVGTVYNFCTPHRSLRLGCPLGNAKWSARTPAMAAGLTHHLWSVGELLCYQGAPSPYVAPKRRGRPPGTKANPETKGAKQYVTV